MCFCLYVFVRACVRECCVSDFCKLDRFLLLLNFRKILPLNFCLFHECSLGQGKNFMFMVKSWSKGIMSLPRRFFSLLVIVFYSLSAVHSCTAANLPKKCFFPAHNNTPF
jgi:hypothetical protein